MTTPQRRASVRPLQAQANRREAFENEFVLVTETTYPVGGSVAMHTHRYPQALYVIEGGQAETTAPDGTVQRLDLETGDVHWRAPQSHSTRNVGAGVLRIVEVEVKDTATRIGGERAPRVAEPADLQWRSDPLDPAREMALLAGDPTVPGPYTVRMRARPGYAIALHQHPGEDENLTVLSGTLHWSCGEPGSGAAEHALRAGGFVLFPAGTPHRLWVTEETVLQMSGVGPRTYVY